MKKFISTILTFTFILLSNLIYAGEHDLTNVNPDYSGTYIPVCFDQNFKKFMSFDKGFSSYGNARCILMLSENICYTNARFHDGYAIKASEFEKWTFIQKDEELYILDENGCSYRRISKDYENGYKVFDNYILKYLFQDAEHFNNIHVENNKVYIDSEEFMVNKDAGFCSGINVACWLYGKTENYALCIEGIGAKLYKAIPGSWAMETVKSNEVYKTIPYFYWKDSSYPNIKCWNLTKDEYRFARNLIFAKHGYNFKTPEVRAIFANTDFYKENPAFSEESFSKEEKELLKRIQEREKQ